MSDEEVIITEDSELLDEGYLESGQVIQDEETEKRIRDYLLDELDNVLNGDVRQKLMEKVEVWRRQREAQPEQEQKSFPWEKASNVSVPLSMMCTNGITSLIKNSLMERDPFWNIQSTEMISTRMQADALTSGLDRLSDSPYHLNLKKQLGDIVYDLVSLGTAFIKVPWIEDHWSFKNETGQVVDKVKSKSPRVVPIRFEDFVTQPYWSDLQRAPWVGHISYLMEHELLQRKRLGIYENIDTVLSGGPDDIDEGRQEQLRRIGIALGSDQDTKMYGIAEIYLFEDVDGDGFPEDIIVWLHPETGTILRAEFNTLGVRPFVRIPYFDRPNELYAIGVGWIVERLQEEIDTLHNMRIDGTQLSMLQMYVTGKSSDIGPGETFRPLKNIRTENPKEDFFPISFPDISPGTIQAEYVTKEYADRATGATDAMMGFESFAGSSRRTASGTKFLAQQNLRTLQPVIQGVEDALGEVGRIVVFQLIRHRENLGDTLNKLVGPEDKGPINEALDIPLEDIPSAFKFKIKTTDMEKTEEAKRQSKMSMIQLYTMFGQQVFQLLPMIYGQQQQVPPEIKKVAAKFFVGATNMMEDVFKFYGEERTNRYLPYVKDLQMALQMMDLMKEQKLFKGGTTGNVRGNSPQGGPEPQAGPGPMGPSTGMGSPEGPNAEGPA